MPNRLRSADLPITARQRDVLACVTDYWFANGFPATIRELCEMLGFASPNAVMAHITPLIAKRYIRKVSITRHGQKRTVYVPFRAELRVAPARGTGVTVGSVGGPVGFTRAEWVAWLRAELRRQGAR